MEIVFKTSKMKKICEDHKRLCREYGQQQAEKIIKRINELASAENLFDISKLPQAGLHPLIGNLKGTFAIDLKHPKRIILTPMNGDRVDLKTITKIEVTEVGVDYH